MSASAYPSFRDLLIAASLKRLDPDEAARLSAATFRDLLIAASLKLDRLKAAETHLQRLSAIC